MKLKQLFLLLFVLLLFSSFVISAPFDFTGCSINEADYLFANDSGYYSWGNAEILYFLTGGVDSGGTEKVKYFMENIYWSDNGGAKMNLNLIQGVIGSDYVVELIADATGTAPNWGYYSGSMQNTGMPSTHAIYHNISFLLDYGADGSNITDNGNSFNGSGLENSAKDFDALRARCGSTSCSFDRLYIWNCTDAECNCPTGVDTTPPVITNSTWNVTSAFNPDNQTIWRTDNAIYSITTDDTPTITFTTDDVSRCAVSTIEDRYTDMVTDESTTNCTGTIDSTEQICTLPSARSLSKGQQEIYVSCQNGDGYQSGDGVSTSGPLSISYGYTVDSCMDLNDTGLFYVMNASIVNADSSTQCIDLRADEVIFDCDGFSIDADDVKDYAITIFNSSTIVRNCILNDWDTSAIYFYNGNNSYIDNVSIKGITDRGIFSSNVVGSDRYGLIINNTIINMSQATTDVDNGIELIPANNVVIENTVIEALGSAGYGIYFESIGQNNLTDVNITTKGWDIQHISSTNSIYCNFKYDNVLGSNNKQEIVFFNSAVNLNGWNNNFSEMILCNADNSNLNDITYDGPSDRTNGIYSVGSSGVIIENSSFKDYEDLYFYVGTTIFRNNTFNNGDIDGIYLYYTDNCLIYDNDFINIDQDGVNIGSGSDNNIVANNTFQDMADSAVYISSGSFGGNIIYNNLINISSGTNYIDSANTLGQDDFNTSLQEGVRIYSAGTQIGGNYYTTSSNNGYSDTCDDTNTDGFCDDAFSGTNNAVDYHPLSNKYSADTCSYSSGNWIINCADNCVISSPVDLGGNNIVIQGEGTFTTTANIINYGDLKILGNGPSNQCSVKCLGGCFLD